jgi:quercetin dioxygenase-like cupin family protein
MEIKRSGSQPSGKGPAEYFTGTVRVDPLFNPPAPARAFGASVTFEPGARTGQRGLRENAQSRCEVPLLH